jgi:hypothetical protein
MIDRVHDSATRKVAAAGAVAYLISFALVVFVQFAIHAPLFVAGHAETARNILANEGRLHISIALDLLFCLGTVVVAGAYYNLLERFGRTIALVAAMARVIYAAMWILATVRLADVLRTLKGADSLSTIDTERLQALAQMHLSGRMDDYYIGLPFWAVSATLIACLWLQSRYIPRRFALAGIAASGWAVVCAFAYLAGPRFANIVNPWWFDSPLVLFELAVAVWILVKGIAMPVSMIAMGAESTARALGPDSSVVSQIRVPEHR